MTDVIISVTESDARQKYPAKRDARVVTVLNRHTAARGINATGLYITPAAHKHPALRDMLTSVAPCFVIAGNTAILDYIRSEVEA